MPSARCCLCKKGAPATLHCFPKNYENLALWKEICNYDDRDDVSRLKLCSNHFLPEDYFEPNAKQLGGSLRLKPDSIPSVSVPVRLKKCKPLRSLILTEPSVSTENTKLETVKLPEVPSSTIQSKDSVVSIRKRLFSAKTPPKEVTSSNIDNVLDESMQCTPKKRRFYSPRYVGEIRSPDVATPRRAKRALALAQADIRKKAKQIKALQGKVGRLQKKVSSLQGLLKHLRTKNILSEDAGDTLMAILPESVKQLIGRQLQAKRKRRFSPALREFALSLQFYSAKAYNYVRKTWKNMLPHPSTIRAWYAVVDGKPGFSKEALSAIQKQSSTQNILVNVVIDEMVLREQRVFDGSRFYGGVDLGNNISNQDGDNIPLARNALVFMAVCVNSGWKVPIAYFLIKSLTGSERANLLKTCLELLHETGAHVKSITFDGAAVNLSMCHNLGANFNFSSNDFKPWIIHPTTNEKIYVFFDACHMIKLVRNTLGDKGIIIDGDNNKIQWLHIKQLNTVQLDEGVHLATKIRKKHIQYYDNRMNVKLATQTLSKSVHNALLYLKQTKYNKYFEDCEGTSQFCLIFNNIFDVLNSRNKFAKTNKFNKPLSSDTEEYVKNQATKFIAYICSLKDTRGVKLIDGPRKMGFVGFIVDLVNIFKYYDDVKDIIDYLLTFKLSQDFIETYFGAIRSRGGFNNNPNAKQFESAFKRLLIRSEIKIYDNANCLADGLDILHVSSKRSRYVYPLVDSDENISADVFDHDYINTMWNFNSYVKDVIEYISGYVVKKILSLNICVTCKSYLTSSERKCTLINLKNEGRLIYPSKDVITICQTSEKIYRENITKIFKQNIKLIMVNECVRRCSHIVFNNNELIQHVQNQDYLDNHIVQLIKIIVTKYFDIRLYHDCKLNSEKNQYIRSKYHKLVLFKNQ